MAWRALSERNVSRTPTLESWSSLIFWLPLSLACNLSSPLIDQTKLEWVDNLLAAGTTGVNHNIPTDGRTAVLTVTRLDGKAKAIYSTQLKEQKSEARQQKKAEKKQSKEEKKLKRQSVPASGVSTSEEVASPKKKWYKRISMAA